MLVIPHTALENHLSALGKSGHMRAAGVLFGSEVSPGNSPLRGFLVV